MNNKYLKLLKHKKLIFGAGFLAVILFFLGNTLVNAENYSFTRKDIFQQTTRGTGAIKILIYRGNQNTSETKFELKNSKSEVISSFSLENKEAYLENYISSGVYTLADTSGGGWISSVKCIDGQRFDSLPAKINLYDNQALECYLSDKPLEVYSWGSKKNMFSYPENESNLSVFSWIEKNNVSIVEKTQKLKFSILNNQGSVIRSFELAHNDGIFLNLNSDFYTLTSEKKEGFAPFVIDCNKNKTKATKADVRVGGDAVVCTYKFKTEIIKSSTSTLVATSTKNINATSASLIVEKSTTGILSETIRLGAKNEKVFILQGLLRNQSVFNGTLDGSFGKITLRAVKDFQIKRGLYVDGVVGPKTIKELYLN